MAFILCTVPSLPPSHPPLALPGQLPKAGFCQCVTKVSRCDQTFYYHQTGCLQYAWVCVLIHMHVHIYACKELQAFRPLTIASVSKVSARIVMRGKTLETRLEESEREPVWRS